MLDLQERIIEILKQPQLSALATITADGKPWVRYVMIVGDDDMTLRCASFVHARKVSQIQHNPEVHLTCGVTDPAVMKPYLQIQGRAAFTTMEQERHAFWNPMLEPIFDGPDDPKYGIVMVEPYRVEFCSPGTYTPEVWERGTATA